MKSALPVKIKSGVKELFHEAYKRLSIKEHRLNYLFFEITRKCNLNCLHCGSDCTRASLNAELTTESWIKIAEYIESVYGNQVNIVITGGEPTLHKDLYEIGGAISRLGMNWGMVTNGTTLTRDTMQRIEASGCQSLTLSVDGMEASHNYLRNTPSAWNHVVHAAENLGKSSLRFKDAVTCVFPHNLHELDQVAEFLLNNGIKTWRLFRIFPSGRASVNKELGLSYAQTQMMIEWIRQNKVALHNRGLRLNLSCEGWLPFSEDIQVRDFPFFCRAGVNFASILADGTITGCSNNNPCFYEGNILTDNFATLWEKGFRKFRNREWLVNTVCNTCRFVKKCQGGSIHLWDLKNDRPGFCYAKAFD